MEAEWGEERPTNRIVDGRSGTGRETAVAGLGSSMDLVWVGWAHSNPSRIN
jgi:hypothetical protein